MKKIIKIFTLTLFIILFFGITTSQAFTMTKVTTAEEMLEALRNGDYITGITSSILHGNAYCFCRDRYTHVNETAQYKFDGGEGNKITYDTTTPLDIENEYAKAYILAAPGYEKYKDRQKAWWVILGQYNYENDLLNTAYDYQDFKITEEETKITYTEAKTAFNGNDIIYGPIKIEYSYAEGARTGKSFGGFNYKLIDIDNNVDKATLCIYENDTYVPITSTKNADGYYEVRTSEYNNKDLYVVTQDMSISKINLKIQENREDYTAETYDISGTYTIDKTHTVYCALCQEKMEATMSRPTQPSVSLEIGDLIRMSNNNFYEFTGVEVVDVYNEEKQNNIFKLDDSYITINGSVAYDGKNYPIFTEAYYCKYCGSTGGYYDSADPGLIMSDGKHTTLYSVNAIQCLICHEKCNESLLHDESSLCIFNGLDKVKTHFKNKHVGTGYKTTRLVYNYEKFAGCGVQNCGDTFVAGTYKSQYLFIVDSTTSNNSTDLKLDIEIQLSTSIEITKEWEDNNNKYNLRPESLKFNVFRSTDKESWTKLIENTDYKVTIQNSEDNTWKIVISDLVRKDENENNYYFKVEEQELNYYDAVYPNGKNPVYNEDTMNWNMTIKNSLKEINLSGYVWLDEQTGIKPALKPNGIMDASETRMEGITVYLYYKDPSTGNTSKVATTVTDKNGYYEFKDRNIGYYYVEFEYDGIHYEDTIAVEGGSSKAFEADEKRNIFNKRFETITYGKSNDGTILKYNYADGKSTLITSDGNKVKAEFIMNATTEAGMYSKETTNLNLGLVKRGVDIALSTNVADAEVNINGQKTTYTYSKSDDTIVISNGQTSEKVSYNLNLYTSDYYYRIRNYISNSEFKENGYVNENAPEGTTTGTELKVDVKYALSLQNQSAETVKINEVKYVFDEKYTFKGITDGSYATSVSGNVITMNLNGLELKEGETKTLYLLFEVNNNDGLSLGDFSNKAEITSYSTTEGLIDDDSQPGNFINDNQAEDDSDTAGGLTIKIEDTIIRKITGKVFDKDNNNVNDVIAQLIELKTINGKVYEYIWQETVSGSGKGFKLNNNGTALEEYTYTKADGIYEFVGIIPGDYIVRFIYGDGTTYDMTENVIKYNGQDYKSMTDSNYNAEWYNSSSYTEGASVARDNEARRLETMAYAVDINVEKGVLLKLLDNVELNETEKEVIIATYNNLYDPDITTVTEEVINKLLKEQVLKNTWMCAETSKIKVAVDAENITNTSTTTIVNGINKAYVEEISNINLGLELRPATKIELKKYITGFKLTASNGQTLVNAYIDVNEYLNNLADISNKVQGIRDNVTILDTVWQYEVAPTEVNAIVDGASLEFEYTLVVKNTGDTDYLSAELAEAYKNNDIADYATILTNKASEIKGYWRTGIYNTQIGNNLGKNYYAGGTGNAKVLTEVTNIRDYINNDLTFISSGGDVVVDESAPHNYRILRDDYSMQQATINTVLKTTKTTGKMENNGEAIIYTIALGKNPISSTGNLNFENYIAEVMSYTNAAGRRAMTSTPGNAEIIDHEHRAGKTHEIDEADTARIQIGAATGEDSNTYNILIVAVVAGITLVTIGAVLVKKYVI